MNILLAVFLQLLFLMLSLTTGIFGAAPLLLLYRTYPRIIVFAIQAATIIIAVAAKAPMLALVVFCINVTIALYASMKKQKLYRRALISVFSGSIIFMSALTSYIAFALHEEVASWLGKEIGGYLKQSQALLGEVHIDIHTIVYQMPSIIMVLFALNLWFAILIDSKTQKKLGTSKAEAEIKNFKVPEALIWVAIAALLFSFVKTPIPGLQEAALNVLNLSLLLYFFQGLSVVSYILTSVNAGVFMKIIIYGISLPSYFYQYVLESWIFG